MSRVINPETPGKQRNQLLKALCVTLIELTKYQDFNKKSRDLSAFAMMTLEAISGTVKSTVSAWEKRGYWIKADKFRIEWAWVDPCAEILHVAICSNNWKETIGVREVLSAKTSSIYISPRHRMGTPWVGAWEKMDKRN